MKNKIFSSLKADFPAGIVVFLVALPLCLGIAIASKADPFSGLIAGIVGGIVIASLSNSPLSVSGPAAGLAALVAGAIGSIGDFRLFLCAVVIAGLIQILMGVFKIGGIVNYIPNSVIKGMLTSIGILIVWKQIPHAFGYDRDEKGNITELVTFGEEGFFDFIKPLQHIDVGVFIITIIAILIMIFWDKSSLKKNKLPFIPGALLAVVFGIVLNQIWLSMDSFLKITDEAHLVKVPVAKSSTEFFSFFSIANFKGFTNPSVLMFGLIIAIIASLETLLSIEAIDKMDPQGRETNVNRELMAQGVGNSISGLIGGLPITSVIVRSSANLNAGAQSKLSAIIHSVLLLLCVVLIPNILNLIPLGTLAAILLLTGFKLASPTVFKDAANKGNKYFLPFIVTVGVIIFVDLIHIVPALTGKGLIIGVAVGFLVSLAIGNKLQINTSEPH